MRGIPSIGQIYRFSSCREARSAVFAEMLFREGCMLPFVEDEPENDNADTSERIGWPKSKIGLLHERPQTAMSVTDPIAIHDPAASTNTARTTPSAAVKNPRDRQHQV
jgi:hypothetical protein